jgi:Peptidase propeptide and YPEB domain
MAITDWQGALEQKEVEGLPASATLLRSFKFMRKTLHRCTFAVIVSLMVGTPAFALSDTNIELIKYAEFTMVEAARSAITFVPGRAVEASLGKREGRTVWKIEIIDATNKRQTVYIDAQTGEAHCDK